MEAYVTEWLGILFRWFHVIAAIAWIGHAFLFHTFEHGLRRPEVDDVSPDVLGEMWMVHGGGFFRLQKTRVLPARYTGELVWFKWEAAFTWISGVLLLVLVFYMGGGVYLVDPSVSDIRPAAAMGLSLGTLIAGWIFYDLVWSSPLGKRPAVAGALTVAMIAGVTIGLTQVLSGRAAYIHVGGLLGTIMVANVWMRILPGARKMVAALEKGQEPDLGLGALGKQRSLHNGYMHFPVIFIMISNHFPSTYAHAHNWLVLLLIMAAGAGMRQALYDGLTRTHIAVKLMLVASVAGLVYLTWPQSERPDPAAMDSAAQTGKPVDPATTGVIRGVVGFVGESPAPAELSLGGGCESMDDRPLHDRAVVVNQGKLANVFVWIRQGHEDWRAPPPPSSAVEIDQRGCMYAPRVAGARVGQPVTFINRDPLFHNVRSVSEDNAVFNLMMPAKEQRETRTFKRPEVMVQARCDVHPWMRAYIGVVPHPWFAVSDESGAFAIEGVPPGTYGIEAWHEVFGTAAETVTVPERGAIDLSFSFSR
jgi:uncharacterized membrane protein/plastocyanin